MRVSKRLSLYDRREVGERGKEGVREKVVKREEVE